MPTVAHFKCGKCHQLATHEIVHISDDLKHDAHLVKVFTQKSIQVLKSNNVNICKIIEFTDQVPSQYKNRTAFNHLANAKIPVQNYSGVRHRKSMYWEGETRCNQISKIWAGSSKQCTEFL